MTELRIYQIDAFTDRLFAGNPAAICPLEQWLDDSKLQSIAAENNLSETAYYIAKDDPGLYDLRWFTPTHEVDLCGHATLATAHLLLCVLENRIGTVRFDTRSGRLEVRRPSDDNTVLQMDLPLFPPDPTLPTPSVTTELGLPPEKVCATPNGNLLTLFENEENVALLIPDFRQLAKLDPYCVIATAPGETVDFVSRFFAPAKGIDEDPVTGSAHSSLAPFWAEKLQKHELTARQISSRGGDLFCRLHDSRVEIEGRCILYLEGRIQIG